MTYLAYDPTLLTALQRRMRMATDELRSLRSDDPETAIALRTVRMAADDLEHHWLVVVGGVLHGTPLHGATPSHDLDALDSATARAMAVQRGWAVAPDPTVDDMMTDADALALADRLGELDLHEVANDPHTVQWLTDRWRRIARSASLSTAFIERCPRWTELADLLAARQPHDFAADQALTALTGLLHRAPSTWADAVQPYTAALLLRTLQVGSKELAALTDRLLQLPRWPLDEAPDANRADVLLGTLLRDPVACTHYLELAMSHPNTLFDHLTDPTLANRVVLKATDPRFVDEATAGRLVPGLIRWFDDQPERDPGLLLVDLITPWTVQFSPTHHAWQLDTDTRNRLLGIAMHSDGALQRFIDNEAAIIGAAHRSFSSHTAHRGELLSGWVGLIGGLIMNERVRGATERRKAWDMLCNIAALAASLAPGVALGVGVSIAVMVIHDHHGPDVVKETHDAVWGKSAAVTKAAEYLAREVHRLWVANGRLPRNFAEPPRIDTTVVSPSEQWYNDFEDWMFTLPGGIDGTMANEARHAVWAALNPWLVGELSSQA